MDDTNLIDFDIILVFSMGSSESTLCANVPINDDTLLEGDEQFTITITDVGSHALINIEASITTVVVTDNDCKLCTQTPVSIVVDTNFLSSWKHCIASNTYCD